MNSAMSKRVLITGANGFLGRRIGDRLHAHGWEVWTLSRAPADESSHRLHWDPEVGDLDRHDVEGFDAVVHLAGEPLVGLWTEGKKRSIMQSRRQGTRLLAEALAAAQHKPAVLVSSGAIGYYGDRGDELLREDSGSGKGFLAEVCEHWEDAAQPARDVGIRVVNLRIGLVLGREGGMMERLLPVFRFGLGGRIGSGKQWWSWVSVEDVAGIAEFAIAHDSVEGPVNVVSPEPVTNAQFTKALGGRMRRPTVFAVPRFAVRAVAREVADEMLLASQRVSSGAIEAAGYEFRHKVLDDALEEVLK